VSGARLPRTALSGARTASTVAVRYENRWQANVKIAYISIAAAALALSYGLLIPLGTSAVDGYINEDGVIEWLGALALLAASALFLLAFLRSRRQSEYGRVKRLALFLLAVAFFFGAGEELSWGQRILGLETPAGLLDANRQDEINVHNFGALNDDGPVPVWRWFQLFWISFGILLPATAALSSRVRRSVGRFLPILPLWLALLLVVNQALSELISAIVSSQPDLYRGTTAIAVLADERAEITEANVALLFAAGALAVLGQVSRLEPRTD
jgi:hypothetical protein